MENHKFFLPRLFNTSTDGVPLEILQWRWDWKTIVMLLRGSPVSLMIVAFLSMVPQHDGQIYRQTQMGKQYRTVIMLVHSESSCYKTYFEYRKVLFTTAFYLKRVHCSKRPLFAWHVYCSCRRTFQCCTAQSVMSSERTLWQNAVWEG